MRQSHSAFSSLHFGLKRTFRKGVKFACCLAVLSAPALSSSVFAGTLEEETAPSLEEKHAWRQSKATSLLPPKP